METLTIDDLTIELRRSKRRKTADLVVDRSGEIVFSIPADFTKKKIEGLVRSRLEWIYQTLGNKQKLLHPKVEKEFVTGEGFYYLGKKYRLKVIRPESGEICPDALMLKNGRFCLAAEVVDGGLSHFQKWYSKQAKKWIDKELPKMAERVGVKPGPVKIMDLKNRWASCSKNGGLNFHWRVILLPSAMIRYLILHELVHLLEHSHNPRFYEILERVAPDYQESEDWLKLNGDRYSL